MVNSFHNTIEEQGENLRSSEKAAKGQEEIIYNFFVNNPDSVLTPPEVQIQAGMTNAPLTSVRRSITNLTNKGLLTKTKAQRKGIYGKPNYVWKLSVAWYSKKESDVYNELEKQKEQVPIESYSSQNSLFQ